MKQQIREISMVNIVFGLSRSLEIKFNSAVSLFTYDFLLMFNTNIVSAITIPF